MQNTPILRMLCPLHTPETRKLNAAGNEKHNIRTSSDPTFQISAETRKAGAEEERQRDGTAPSGQERSAAVHIYIPLLCGLGSEVVAPAVVEDVVSYLLPAD